MSKVTKSSTKDEILEALTEAKEEVNILHTEVTSLNGKIEGLETMATEKVEVIVELEALVQQEDGKKKGLIKELASQSTDIELAKQQTVELDDLSSKLGQAHAELDSAKKEMEAVQSELFAANKKVKLLTTELESFKNRALPSGIKRGFGRFFSFKKMAVVSVIVFVSVISFGAIYMVVPHDNAFMDKIDKIISRVQHNIPIEIVNPLAAMTFTKTNDVITARHDDGTELQTKDGVTIDDSVIVTWALKAGFDGVLFGTLTDLYDKVDLEQNNADPYENTEIDINHIASRFKELGCTNVLALVENRGDLTLPEIFTHSSKGKLEVYESRRKLAGFFPVFWGKEKTQMNIKSDNVYAYITSDGIFMEVKGVKAYAKLNVIEEDTSSTE